MTIESPVPISEKYKLQRQVPQYNNAAGRLLSLLLGFTADQNYFDNITKMYDVGPYVSQDEKVQLYIAFIAMLGDCYGECMQAIQNSSQIPDEASELFLSGLASLKYKIFTNAPGANWPGLAETEHAYLNMAGSLLEKEQALEDEELDGILGLIDKLMSQLNSANIGEEARKSLADLIRHARFAVDYYRIYGVEGFRTALKKMIGDYFEAISKDDNAARDGGVTKEFGHLLARFDQIYSRVIKYKPLLEAGARFFLPGGAG
jgi:hypothetical protein